MRFRRYRDGDAFAELVQKHGPIVWGACRQVLGSHHDAEDAFQATFLILSQHAPSAHRVNSLAGWLYRVAYRTALRTRRQRRHQGEHQAIEELRSTDDVFASISLKELQSVLHDALARMPEQYQAPLVLCYLQGKTRTEAAEELDCTDAAVKARLARGRKMLRSRLVRRGIALSAAVTATSAAVAEAAHQLTPMLIQSTVEGCMGAVSVGNTATQVSTHAQSLAREGGRTMLVSKSLQIAAVFLGAATLGILGIMGFTDAGASGSPQTSARLRATTTNDSKLGSAEDEGLAVVLGGFPTVTLDQQEESTFQAAAEAPSATTKASTNQDRSPPSSQVVEPPLEYAFLERRAVFLQARADVLRLKAEAKALEADAALANEAEGKALLQRARALDAKADARMLLAEADRAADEAALIRRHAMAFQSGNPVTISPGNSVAIVVTGTLPEAPIAGQFQVEPTGTVPLGPHYGRVKIAGMTLIEAEKAIDEHLKNRGDLIEPRVQVTYLHSGLPNNVGFGQQ